MRKKGGYSKRIAKFPLKDVDLKIVKGEDLGIHESKKVLFKDFAEEGSFEIKPTAIVVLNIGIRRELSVLLIRGCQFN